MESFFFSSRRRHTRFDCDWSSDVCSSDLPRDAAAGVEDLLLAGVERVAVRADLDVDRAAGSGAPRGERVPAAARHGGDVVLGVNVSLHVTTPASSGRRVAPQDGNRYRMIAASSVPDRETIFPGVEFPLAVAGQRVVRTPARLRNRAWSSAPAGGTRRCSWSCVAAPSAARAPAAARARAAPGAAAR